MLPIHFTSKNLQCSVPKFGALSKTHVALPLLYVKMRRWLENVISDTVVRALSSSALCAVACTFMVFTVAGSHVTGLRLSFYC